MIRSTLLVARQKLVLVFVLFVLAGIDQTSASSQTPILGADINKLIVDTMLAKGMTASPQLSKSRKFLACQTGLSVEQMFGSLKTVKVFCNDEGGWGVMVRTNLKTAQKAKAVPKKLTVGSTGATGTSVRAKATPNVATMALKRRSQVEIMNILALGRSMTRGDVIMPRDIITMAVPINAVSGVFFDPEDIIGRKLKTSVTARKPIQARHLNPKWLVEEDDEVVIQNQAGGISVDMVGVALENGQFGEWIKVQNLSSGIVVVGQIKNKKIISTNAKISPERVVY